MLEVGTALHLMIWREDAQEWDWRVIDDCPSRMGLNRAVNIDAVGNPIQYAEGTVGARACATQRIFTAGLPGARPVLVPERRLLLTVDIGEAVLTRQGWRDEDAAGL